MLSSQIDAYGRCQGRDSGAHQGWNVLKWLQCSTQVESAEVFWSGDTSQDLHIRSSRD